MFKSLFQNTGMLSLFIIRRDRVHLAVWLISLILMTVLIAAAYTNLVSTEEERLVMAETMRNPAVTAMFGPGYGLDNYHRGAIMGHQMLLFTALLVAIMAIFFAARHTRNDEEEGRLEMLRSLPIGSLSNIAATLIVSFCVFLLLALATGLGLAALRIETMDLQGSLMYGAVLGVTGFIFTGFTVFFAQISSTNRGCMGLSFAFLGLGYIVRGIGDVSAEALSWTTPLGWVLRAEVYVNNYWWPIFLTLAAGFLITFLALYLNSIRDLGAGFLPSKPGKKNASLFLQTPMGFAWRILRTSFIGWAIGIFVLGASYGSVLGDMDAYIETMDIMQQMLIEAEGFTITEQFLPMLMAVMAMSSAIPTLLMLLKLSNEESRGRADNILAKAVSRNRFFGSFTVLSIIAAIFMLFISALGLWSVATIVMDDALSFTTVLFSALAYLPALLLLSGFAAFIVGSLPRRTILPWLYLAYSFFVVYFGSLMNLPSFLVKLSPFGHVSRLPVESLDITKAGILLVIALLLYLIGFAGYSKRDIQG